MKLPYFKKEQLSMIERIVLFGVLLVSIYGAFMMFCPRYSNFTFDTQAILLWDYAASINLVPFRDIFYPYGLLYYFKNQHFIFSILYILLPSILFTLIFYTNKKIWNDKWLHILSFIFFFLFIESVTGIDSFSRYGVLVVIACIFANILFSYKNNLSLKKLLFIGISLGLLFPLLIDQALYAILLFVLLSFCDKLIRKTICDYILFTKEILIFVIGVFFGSIPFLFYLWVTQSLQSFITYLLYLPQISLLAKTPFIHSLRTADNIFTLFMLLITILYIFHKIFYIKKKLTSINYMQIALIMSLCLFELKNIIRSIDTSISFAALLLLFCLLSEIRSCFIDSAISKRNITIYYGNIFIIIYVLFTHSSISSFQLSSPITVIKNIQANACMTNNVSSFLEKNSAYEHVIKKLPDVKAKIFSYPGDPIFYILIHQKPPYFPSIYEASSYESQQKQIDYMNEQKVKYVIYDLKDASIQDEVPDLLRTPLLHKFIISHFSIRTKIDNFLLLERSTEDIFNSSQLKNAPELIHILTNLDFQNIPRSEGFYKNTLLSLIGNTQRVVVNTQEKLTNYLQDHPTDSDKKFLVISSDNQNSKELKLTVTTTDELTSQLVFKSCTNGGVCIIDLAHIPIFYKTRKIKNIILDPFPGNTVSFYQMTNLEALW